MTQVKYQTRPGTSIHKLVNELLTGIPVLMNEPSKNTGTHAPVNITEEEMGYRLDVITPGFTRSELNVKLEDNILTITGERSEENNKEGQGKKIRNEYAYTNFKRSFTIDEKIDATGIQASYVNGVLTLNFPKRKEVKEAAKEITIE